MAMNRTILLVLLVECGAALLASCDRKAAPSPSPDLRVAYELREKCGKEAGDWFKREYGDDASADGGGVSTIQNEYTNHYNSKMNQCYALVLNAKLVFPGQGKDEVNVKRAALVDVNENRTIGAYFFNSERGSPVACIVGDHKCESLAEWQALVTPYMNQ
jgi:hypothetical protein